MSLNRAEKVHEELGSFVEMLLAEHSEFSWAEVTKRGRNVKKNLCESLYLGQEGDRDEG